MTEKSIESSSNRKSNLENEVKPVESAKCTNINIVKSTELSSKDELILENEDKLIETAKSTDIIVNTMESGEKSLKKGI